MEVGPRLVDSDIGNSARISEEQFVFNLGLTVDVASRLVNYLFGCNLSRKLIMLHGSADLINSYNTFLSL